ncbi:Flp pilus assembly protein CpaB [Oricola cellulosilytica]|uniref:Flp pilus assembly protein CpaB n=1 Tax=Oricola cellulosilytica TaxID=1429082 RepID=A0A4R0PHZ7_9HYPH|nr:Flp pilus assembly protein CpaB [Oricola cellulosilytica]TCD16180.1 Flp pilus assembly protein CpaB [Oricola cellulosilytica]
MRFTTVLSLGLSIILAMAAVFGVRQFLADQSERIANVSTVDVPRNTIVVAAQPMRFGRLIEPSSLRVIDWPAATIPEGAFSTIEDVLAPDGESRYVMTAIESGEPVLASKITGAGQRATLSTALDPGMKAVSIRVNDVLGVAGFVLPGDRVDIMLTREGTTDVLLQGVKVLAIDQLADDRANQPSIARTVTMEVSTLEAQKLTLAATVGILSLALRNSASSEVEAINPVNINDLGGGPTSRTLISEQVKALEDARLSELEEKVSQVDELVSKRVAKLRQEMETSPQPGVERQKELVMPPEDPYANIGVYRGAGRTEYKVKKAE